MCVAQNIIETSGVSQLCYLTCIGTGQACIAETCPTCLVPSPDGETLNNVTVACNICIGGSLNQGGSLQPAPGLECVNGLFECAFNVECVNPFWWKNGRCDPQNNTPECAYDGEQDICWQYLQLGA